MTDRRTQDMIAKAALHKQRTDEEAMTIALFREYIDAREGAGWSSEARCIAKTFHSLFTSCLSVERIVRVAEALTCCKLDEDAVRAELTRMTKAKVLRARTQRGVRLYEVNY